MLVHKIDRHFGHFLKEAKNRDKDSDMGQVVPQLTLPAWLPVFLYPSL